MKPGPALTTGMAAILAVVLTRIAVPMITQEEGIRYRPYPDIGGIMTVCSGHTNTDVVVNKVYSPAECASLTLKDAKTAADGVLKYSPELINHKYMLASAISFSYNVGVGTYEHSSVRRAFDSGHFVTACNDLLKYDMAGGKHSVGLHNRRVREREVCLTPEGVPNASNTTSTPGSYR